eukprot:CAMPEP_0117427630 /NCGR_PEP_ID=MMETSP0758-20121206/7457_1 /TAXON_ID=63605 /ORGANISM="Percolomonas cosmopolitus, Strain AE-1 (ATCC 50343)" /LENGTH=462 /DNA_ID=CAMNT_0005213417 /DNA_START=437 /DNA_END=1825 /DNA_ORIENTATION=+
MHWPCRRIDLGKTPRFVVYDEEQDLFIVIVSSVKELVIIKRDDEDALDDADDMDDSDDDDTELPTQVLDKYEAFLYDSDFNLLDSLEFDDLHLVLECKIIRFAWGFVDEDSAYHRISDHHGKRVSKLVVSVCMYGGEDELAFSKLMAFSFQGDSNSPPSFSHQASIQSKSIISNFVECDGYLCISEGQKIVAYYFDTKLSKLTHCGLHFSEFLVKDMKSFKNYILYADMYSGIHLLRWRDFDKTLELVTEEISNVRTNACDFLVGDPSMLLFASMDAYRNLHLYQFGERDYSFFWHKSSKRYLSPLYKRDIHMGNICHCLQRSYTKKVEGGTKSSAHHFVPNESSEMLLYASTDGSLGYISLFHYRSRKKEKMFKDIPKLLLLMGNHLEQDAGLHPLSFRSSRCPDDVSPPKGGIIDGNALFRFWNLSIKDRHDLLTKLDNLDSSKPILDIIRHFDSSSSIF